jgi:hypothetical protein
MGLPNCCEEIEKLPFWTRAIFFALPIFWLFDLISSIPSYYLASSISTVFSHYRLWTLFTANLYSDRLFFLFIILYNYYSFLPALVPLTPLSNNASPPPSSC